MGELLGGRPPVRAVITGPDLRLAIVSGVMAGLVGLLVPAKLAPLVAAAWLVLLAAHVRVAISGGGTPPISSRELAEWAAFFRLEPWGTEVEDARAALIAATIANTNRDPKKRRKPYTVSDFMPRREPVEEQSWEEQARILEMWTRAFEAKFGGQ